jgi:hypothetical protein
VKLRLDRRAAAAAVLIAWVAGIALLAHRRHSSTDAELLARGALRLDPATYFYTVSQNSEQIGSASSSIDTSANGFTVREVARFRTLISGNSQSVVASSTAYLSRGLALDSFSVAVTGKHPLHDVNAPAAHSGILLPTLAPIALMLTREPRVGFTTSSPIYNPMVGHVERVTMSIAAESLFSVVDSAVFDSAQHHWMPAHLDTVRSWKIVAPSRGIFAWVDSRGRLVAASAPGGAAIERTAYEIATLNPKLPTH